MSRNSHSLLGGVGAVVLISLVPTSLPAFSLGGPILGYHTEAFGYNRQGVDQISGAPVLWPSNLSEEYRINVPNIYYAYDASFLDYFGARGVEEVDKAVKFFNDLPPYSSLSENLTEYPFDTLRENFQASALQLSDLKSVAMWAIIEQMGLLAPEINIWGVQSREAQGPGCPFYNFFVLKRNFDPVTWEPSSFVNGALYTLSWFINCDPDFSFIEPVPVDPLAFSFRSVANYAVPVGQYFTGLTRDDVGGLRYLYRRDNYNVEQMPPDILAGFGGGGGSPWSPVDPNVTNEPAGDTTALRAGLGKVNFIKRNYDSLLGNFFVGLTNNFSVQIVTNRTLRSQSFSRAILQPDIVFGAGNLPIDVADNFTPILRTTPVLQSVGNPVTPNLNGPGALVIGQSRGPISVAFQKAGPAFFASFPNTLSEAALQPMWRWGSFDGSTNAPVLYPSGTSIKDLERQVLGFRN